MSTTDFDFRHHLYDTIILLGGKKEIADLLKASEDYAVTEADIEGIKRYNISLMEQTKTRLVGLNKIKIRTAPTESEGG